tara:strand:- start:239 stop:700 length:462 start_codon:yes stop_codon:yes gene_type:complete
MAISFTNIWQDKIIDPIISALRTEFGNQVNVYISDIFKPEGNCSIRVHGINQSLELISNGAFTNEYTIEIVYYLVSSNYNEKAIEKLYRDVSRIEQLLFNKRQPSGRSESVGSFKFYDGRVESIDINDRTEDEQQVDNLLNARIEYVCRYSKV